MAKRTELGQSLNLKLLLPVIYWSRPGLSTVSAAARTPIRVIRGYHYWVPQSSPMGWCRCSIECAPHLAGHKSVARRVACGVGAASPHPNRFYRSGSVQFKFSTTWQLPGGSHTRDRGASIGRIPDRSVAQWPRSARVSGVGQGDLERVVGGSPWGIKGWGRALRCGTGRALNISGDA
jgi:hypothetical protein